MRDNENVITKNGVFVVSQSKQDTADCKGLRNQILVKIGKNLTPAIKHSLVELKKLECWPMPNVMVALPNIGGALCSTPQTG